MRWLLVIARGSSFRFSSSNFNLDEVRISLNVRYCLSGVIEAFNKQASITVELSDTHDRGIIWSERFTSKIDATHEIRKQIVRAVINALDIRIPLVEAQRAQLKSPDNLDAWSAFHLGLHHMYQFNKSNNATAADYFRRAVSMDKGFARAYAGLSFTHFQDAFLHYSEPTEAAKLARQYAEQCLEWDPVEPFGNFAMGRSCWLIGNLERSLPWLERATALNPNYAQATYSRGWAEALLGNTEKSLKNIDDAQALSPLDPFLYGMLGVRAISHIVSQDYLRAAEWATRAAQAPGAHALIDMIAAVAHALNGDDEMARQWASSARVRAPELTRHDFLRSFPFREGASRARIEAMLKRHGF